MKEERNRSDVFMETEMNRMEESHNTGVTCMISEDNTLDTSFAGKQSFSFPS